MSKAPTQKSNTKGLPQLDQDFCKVEALAKSTERQEGDAQDLLAETLNAMFVFGQQLRRNEKHMEAFFASKGVKLNKTTRENPYNGLVKLAFGEKTKKAMQSKYARVLHFVHDSKHNERVRDFIRDNGIGECYVRANQHFGKARKEAGEIAKAKQIELGQKRLSTLTASSTFQLSGDVSDKLIGVPRWDTESRQAGTETYINAIIRVCADGKTAVVADILDTSSNDWDHIFSRYISRMAAVHSRLAQLPANPILHAIWHVSALATDTASNGTVIVRFKDNAAIVEFASTDQSFRSARMVLDDLPNLALEQPVGIALADAKEFAAVYPGQTDWEISQEPSRILIASKGARRTFVLAPPIKGLNVGVFAGLKSKHFTLPWQRLGTISKEKTLLPSPSSTTQSQGKPLLAMTFDGTSLGLSNVRRGGPPLTFLDMDKADGTILDERYLALSDLQQVCPILYGYEQDLRGAFIRFPNGEADAALQIEHPLPEGKLMLSIPFIMNFGMSVFPACEPM